MKNGFTLIELLIVVAMLGILFLGLIFTLNPLTQFNKAHDAQREHDLSQIKNALDTYYNDTKCYPATLSLLSSKYAQKVPSDPDGTLPYVYQTDSSSCSQWNVVYAGLKAHVPLSNPCPLTSLQSCLPKDYQTSGYNYCVISGNVDCSIIASSTIGPVGGGSSSSSGGNNTTPTPTPTPYIINCPGNNYYGCTGDNRCNSISPITQCFGHGGNIQCYCDSLCRVNGVKQCLH